MCKMLEFYIKKKNVYSIRFLFRKKKKTWTGTISGTLSHNTPDFFLSGQELFYESGWWKLAHNLTPKQYFDLCIQTNFQYLLY